MSETTPEPDDDFVDDGTDRPEPNAADKPPYFHDPENPDLPDAEEPADHVADPVDDTPDEEA